LRGGGPIRARLRGSRRDGYKRASNLSDASSDQSDEDGPMDDSTGSGSTNMDYDVERGMGGGGMGSERYLSLGLRGDDDEEEEGGGDGGAHTHDHHPVSSAQGLLEKSSLGGLASKALLSLKHRSSQPVLQASSHPSARADRPMVYLGRGHDNRQAAMATQGM
jgi:hypothetical protein